MFKILLVLLFSIFIFSCHEPEKPEVVLINPTDSFVINIKNDYELVNMGLINDDTDTIFTMDAQYPTIRLYTKNNKNVYNSIKEIPIPQNDSIDISYSSFSRLDDSTYLLSNSEGLLIFFNKNFDPTDTIYFRHTIGGFTKDRFGIENINTEPMIKLNDSILFIRLVLLEALKGNDLKPYILYNYKNNTVRQPNINWNWPELVFKSIYYENRPSHRVLDPNCISILQPHKDSITIYDWISDSSNTINIGNYFFSLPKKDFFRNEENLTTDRDEYYNHGFLYQLVFSTNNKLFAFFSMPAKDDISYKNFHCVGINLENNKKKYFALEKTLYIFRPSSFFGKDKLFLHLYQEPTSLSNETQPATYHIYDMSQLDF